MGFTQKMMRGPELVGLFSHKNNYFLTKTTDIPGDSIHDLLIHNLGGHDSSFKMVT